MFSTSKLKFCVILPLLWWLYLDAFFLFNASLASFSALAFAACLVVGSSSSSSDLFSFLVKCRLNVSFYHSIFRVKFILLEIVFQLNLMILGKPKKSSSFLSIHLIVFGSEGYPEPNCLDIVPSNPGSVHTQFWTYWSRVTFAHILAALTIGYKASAFGSTVMAIPGKKDDSFFLYEADGPTGST